MIFLGPGRLRPDSAARKLRTLAIALRGSFEWSSGSWPEMSERNFRYSHFFSTKMSADLSFRRGLKCRQPKSTLQFEWHVESRKPDRIVERCPRQIVNGETRSVDLQNLRCARTIDFTSKIQKGRPRGRPDKSLMRDPLNTYRPCRPCLPRLPGSPSRLP